VNLGFKSVVVLIAAFGFLACGNNNSSSITGWTATAGDGQVQLSWDSVSGATSYNVYYSTDSNVNTTSSGKVTGLTTTSTSVTGLTNQTTFYFIVTAVTSSGEGSPSNTLSSTPSGTNTSTATSTAVTGVTATKVGAGQVQVSWAAVTGAISYNVYYGTNSNVGTSSPTNVQGITGTSTTISGLATGVTYYFIVTAVIAPPSSTVSVILN
jgi:fibronectin type 3 domain-containing protein